MCAEDLVQHQSIRKTAACFGVDESTPDLRKRQELQKEIRSEKKRSKALEKELLRKERALAETAALLTLRKKAQAIWGDDEED